VQDSCTELGIELLFAPPRSPWYKGVIECAGGTFNTRFIHWLPGTPLGRPTGDVKACASSQRSAEFASPYRAAPA